MVKLTVGDQVCWSYEGGQTQGEILAIYTVPFLVNGYTHHASVTDPQYKIRCLRTGHIAYHRTSALTLATQKI